MLRVLALAVLLTASTPASARGESWRWPVSGRIVGTFSVSPDAPYAAGQRRGIAIAVPPGAPVRSACPGRVAFAGSVGRAGPTVSVQCGPLRATYQGVADVGVEAGEEVGAGAGIARVGEEGLLRLGARVATNRYVDPAALLAARRPPLGPAPRPSIPRSLRRPPPLPLAAPSRAPERSPPAPAAPLLAWLGLALLAIAAPVGGLVRWRRRRLVVGRPGVIASER